jgi:long-chain acyl-CoA synthetase
MPALVPFDTIPEMFTRVVDHYRGDPRAALRYKAPSTEQWTDITWGDLNDRVESLAGYLYKSGVRPGDRVAILSENRPEWVIIDLATQILGGVNVSLYTSLPEHQVAYILNDSTAKLLFTSTTIQQRKARAVYDDCPSLDTVVTMSAPDSGAGDFVRTWDTVMNEGRRFWDAHAEELATLRENIEPEDLASLIYTSGTTGQPKGVKLTHRNFCSNVKAALNVVAFDHMDHHLSFLPLCHSFERTAGYLAVMACGATISYAESVNAVSRNLEEVEPTVMISVPRLFERMYGLVFKSMEEGSAVKKKVFSWAVSVGRTTARKKLAGEKPGVILRLQQNLADRLVFSKLHEKLGGNLRFAVSGGAALSKEIGEFFMAAGIKIIEGYGLTETAPIVSANPMDRPRFGTVGHVLPGVTIAIQRLEDKAVIGQISGNDYPSSLETGEGEILVKGPNIMEGYWNDEAATREAFDSDGWYHTGDVGRFDKGYLTITDRVKHMIVSKGGKNIYPGPIEDQFTTNQWIDQIMVVGEGREFLCALVVPDYEALEKYAHTEEIDFSETNDLLEKPEIQSLFKQVFRDYSRTASSHEKIRRFRLLSEPFTVENGLMTPTLKLRRKKIEAAYSDTIDAMYDELLSR